MSATFKGKMINDFIPSIKKMIEKEEEHMKFLLKKEEEQMKIISKEEEEKMDILSQEFTNSAIKTSKWHLNHLKQRLSEYISYTEKL